MSFSPSLMALAWKSMRKFQSLNPEDRNIVFYSEDNASWVHLEPIIQTLLDKHQQTICYLTSSPNDPRLSLQDKRIRVFYIGLGVIRTILFVTLQAEIVVMTMPDLENYYVKRSRIYSPQYIYVFHNMASAHMVFRHGAYDNYDVIFCVGPHHIKEIRASEELYNLKPKTLVKHGNSRLDSILNEARFRSTPPNQIDTILIAPSYGEKALLETCGIKLIEIILQGGYRVILRPHPLTLKNHSRLIHQINKTFRGHSNYSMETNIASQDSLHNSDLIISDYSGVAFEFALGLEKPAIFIDVPRKINNPHYEQLNCEPFEISIRSEIGEVISPNKLEPVVPAIKKLIHNRESIRKRIQHIRNENIYNVGSSGKAGADFINEGLQNIRTRKKL